MAYERVLSGIPEKLILGESVSWEFGGGEFPATAWTLTYTLINATVKITIVASADGVDHLVEVTTSTSAAYTAGTYDWQAHVDDGSDERYKVGSGVIELVADFAAETTLDARTHSRIMLDAIEASLEGRASKTQLEQTVNGVQVKHIEPADLLKLRDIYAARVRTEQVRDGTRSSRRTIKVRFVK